jgi:hypothetical protein
MAFVVSAVVAAFAEGATLAIIATAVSEVGIALSVVGAVTGSKELMKIGGVLGIAGGLGSLASLGADALTGAATGTLANESAAETARLAAGEATAASAVGDAPGILGSAMTSAVDVPKNIDFSSISAPDAGAMPSASAAAPQDFSGLPSSATPAVTTGAPAVQPVAPAPVADATTVATPADPSTVSAPSDAYPETAATHSTGNDFYGTPQATPNGSSFDAIKQWFSSLKPETQASVLKGGASAVGGLFQGWTEEQKLALEKNKFSLSQQQYNTQVTNANSVPKLNFASPTPQPNGIINSARGI